ncbi:MAG: hypothetical protein COW01_13635 [Bdellovibrionales bacterium CG12_big_fil_rev_8_21_14_0_65_38_15]|nr:MAG: hypothetical protein COW79_16455 [Bdellovibrionales bacterium CG22_combo_CG10-13_8_21_14_all_38_13]PIQ53315.1 MAG: hypothetical protein COW01_13635 [Bdellovibrionales bacterium CG12_big_fil_rev_8_21_14_0_65_38_15]PIR30323.1 MAG: hypothetical protein COV38_06125 [Bdellovibrionales bacterium CG11_big_fil_rev_8_21_14_0_20_38_13]
MLIMGNYTLIFATLLSLSFASFADSKYINIVHTNDLHSYLTGHADGRGGYAKVKTIIDQLKSEALKRTDLQVGGVESLVLDGGDFGEGTSFFLVDEGVTSFKSLNELGIDAAVIGNHDHMLGIDTLQTQIKKSREGYSKQAKILSANMVIFRDTRMKGLVDSTAIFNIGGVSVSVIGLSTPEPHFQYPILPSFILPAIPVAKEISKLARQNGAELVIALTHLGTKTDEKLVDKTEFIDVVVGGHSHDRYEQPLMIKNSDKRVIPVVQTGAHGLAVGSMLLKVNGPGDVELVEYKLVDVKKETSEDSTVATFVSDATAKRNEYFDGKWDEVVGTSEIKLTGYENGNAVIENSCWGKHQSRMAKEAMETDIGIHMANFQGVVKEAGPVTYGDLVDNYPHFRTYGDQGWNLASFEADGKFIKAFVRALVNLPGQVGIDIDGITWKELKLPGFIPYLGGRIYAYGFKVKGEKVEKDKRYSLAFPSEIGHVLELLVKDKVRYVFPEFNEDKSKPYWSVMEEYVKKNSPIKCLAD